MFLLSRRPLESMAVYYNEIDKNAAQWLRELMKAGVIAEGDVDERSIEEVGIEDVRGYRQCHFFAGIGVWSYALRSAGWRDDRNVWTASCPCPPFSAAGKQKPCPPRAVEKVLCRMLDELAISYASIAAKSGLAAHPKRQSKDDAAQRLRQCHQWRPRHRVRAERDG